jgi:hypothetical protein
LSRDNYRDRALAINLADNQLITIFQDREKKNLPKCWQTKNQFKSTENKCLTLSH